MIKEARQGWGLETALPLGQGGRTSSSESETRRQLCYCEHQVLYMHDTHTDIIVGCSKVQ